jgi:outer membrane protein assembly factor BamB
MALYRFFIFLILPVIMLLSAVGPQRAQAQFLSPMAGSQFELADSVELDRAEAAVLAQLERVKAFLADQKWEEAIDTLVEVMENYDGKLLGVTENRFVGMRDYCQIQLASLPPDALKIYRARVDPMSHKWYEDGNANRDPRPLRMVVDRALSGSWGDDALMALGDMALEAGNYASARWYWERIIPHRAGSNWPGYPDTNLDLAAVRARLVLVSILEGSVDRAHEELDQFARLHGKARGRLGGREVNFAEALGALLTESEVWPARPQNRDWPTFAGSPERNTVSPRKFDAGPAAWRIPLPRIAAQSFRPGVKTAADAAAGLSYHPVIVGDMAFVNTPGEILAVNLNTGKPIWGNVAPAIFHEQLNMAAAEMLAASSTMGTPRFTLTVYSGKLYAYMGAGVTGFPQGQPASGPRGSLVCLDLSAEGRLLWKIESEEGWTFDGTPIVDSSGVYVAMRRIDIRPQAYVACFDVQSGRMRWRRFIVSAETPARGMMSQISHNLLTLAGNSIYFNTNLGAVAAINIDDGRIEWVSLYPRQRQGDLARPDPHWRRDLNPCVYHQGVVYAAPADSPRIFACDAYTGQILWQTGTQTEYALDLLGATDDHLIAGGKKLYWIGLKGEDRGHIKHVWPEGNEKPGFGRGVLADGCVLWPTREQILVFDLKTAQPRKSIDLLPFGAQGGNLLVTDLGLLIATGEELIALRRTKNPPQEKQQEIAYTK